MRFPFVPRRRYDEAVRQLGAEIREAERVRADGDRREHAQERRHALDVAYRDGLHAREAARVDALTKVILRMKQTGAVLLPPESVQATRGPARVQTPIEQAIDNNPRARANPGLARHLFNYAAQAKQDGMQEEDVLEKLRSWGAPTHDDDTEDDAL